MFMVKEQAKFILAIPFKKFVKNRKDIVVSTKVFFNEGKLSKEAILREIEVD